MTFAGRSLCDRAGLSQTCGDAPITQLHRSDSAGQHHGDQQRRTLSVDTLGHSNKAAPTLEAGHIGAPVFKMMSKTQTFLLCMNVTFTLKKSCHGCVTVSHKCCLTKQVLERQNCYTNRRKQNDCTETQSSERCTQNGCKETIIKIQTAKELQCFNKSAQNGRKVTQKDYRVTKGQN